MEFILIALAHFLALLSPGPDFFLIVQSSQRLSPVRIFGLVSGIASANAVYICMAVIGVESLKGIESVFLVLKYLGGGYLVFLGVVLLKSPRQSIPVKGDCNAEGKVLRQYSIGFLSAILNPKNMIFYLSLFTVMVSSMTPIFQRIIYGVWMCAIVFFWDLFVCYCFRRVGRACYNGNIIFAIEKFSGSMLVLSGIILPLN